MRNSQYQFLKRTAGKIHELNESIASWCNSTAVVAGMRICSDNMEHFYMNVHDCRTVQRTKIPAITFNINKHEQYATKSKTLRCAYSVFIHHIHFAQHTIKHRVVLEFRAVTHTRAQPVFTYEIPPVSSQLYPWNPWCMRIILGISRYMREHVDLANSGLCPNTTADNCIMVISKYRRVWRLLNDWKTRHWPASFHSDVVW